MRWGYFILLTVGLLISFGCGQPQGRVPPTGEAELIYQCQRFWTEEQFSALSDTNLMELLNQTYDVDAGDFNFSFDETSHSTVTECHVYGKILKSGDEYVAHFFLVFGSSQSRFYRR